jgi:hypothetical protein
MSGAQFWRMHAPRGTLVLRRWPTEHPTAERLQFIHDVLLHAARNGIEFLAVPIQTSNGLSFVRDAGHLWELAPWMPGKADYETSPSSEKLGAAMAALAQFHIAVAEFPAKSLDKQVGAAPAITRRVCQLSELTQNSLTLLAKSINEQVWPELAPLARRFLALVPKLLPEALQGLTPLAAASFILQPCLRDIWHDHVLFTGNTVTGMIDYGAIEFDTPATDIARLLGSLVAADATGWREGLAAYRRERPLTVNAELAAKALNVCGPIVAGCNWVHWIYVEGRQFENSQQIIQRFQRIVAVCERRSGS